MPPALGCTVPAPSESLGWHLGTRRRRVPGSGSRRVTERGLCSQSPQRQHQTRSGLGSFLYPLARGGIRFWDLEVRSEWPNQSPRAPTRVRRACGRGPFLPKLLGSECQGLKCSPAWARGLHRGLLVCKALGGLSFLGMCTALGAWKVCGWGGRCA